MLKKNNLHYLVIDGMQNDYDNESPEYGMSLQSILNYMYKRGWKYVSHSHRVNESCLQIVFVRKN